MLRLTLLSAISTACGPSPLDTPDIALARHEQSRACAAYRPHRARPETEVLVASQLGVIGAQPPAVVLLDNAFDLMRVCVVTAGVWIRATRPARLPTLAPRAQRMMSQFAVPNGAGTRHELAHVKALLAKESRAAEEALLHRGLGKPSERTTRKDDERSPFVPGVDG